MPLHHHRRILFSYHDDDDHGACKPWSRCTSPPSPPPNIPPPAPSPSPAPSIDSYFPSPPPLDLAPAPSPARNPAAGRRNQGGTNAYAPPPPAAPATNAHHHRRVVVTNVLAASAALVFLSLILLGVSVAVRRWNLRRQRRQSLVAPAPAATTNVGNDDPEGGGGGGVVHHVWYIRTVGLDQAVIDSIAATRYRAGAGLLGAADCSVCLGEFSDGELVRLLPKCGHAFHVPCIDTWLRAHVNCPLCRSDVIDPAAEVGLDANPNSGAPADPDAHAIAAAEQVAIAIDDDSTLEHQDDEEADDQEESRVEEDQHEQQLSSPEPLPHLPCPVPWNVRRAASMDAATVSAAADMAALDRLPEAAPEGEQGDREKDLTGADGRTTSIQRLGSGGPPRFFFSRHCRARSSVLPL